MSYLNLKIGFLLLVLSTTVWADCLVHSADETIIKESFEKGTYRNLPVSDEPKVIDLDGLNFDQYLAKSTQHINALNVRANMPCPINNYVTSQLKLQKPTVLDVVKPYELAHPNRDKVIVLFHGVTDSPYSFHDLSAFFHQQGFTVRTVLLPGHGTAPEHLEYIHYDDWREITEFAIEQATNDFDEVHLGGYSTGGGLVFDYLFSQSELNAKLASIMLFAPATKAKNKHAWASPYINMVPFLTWLEKGADVDVTKYESFSVNAAAQVQNLMNNVYPLKKRYYVHDIPTFVVVTQYDTTIDTAATLAILTDWQSRQRFPLTLVYYGADNDLKDFKQNKQITLVTPQCQEGKCDNKTHIAHISIPHNAENMHYGEQTKNRNCGHYLSDFDQYFLCKTYEDIVALETTAEAKQTYAVFKRATYNPYFKELTEQLTLFIDQHSDGNK
jgi:esterase/lipase